MSKTVLLVEDDALVRESLGNLLKQKGLQVVEATNGKEGLQKAARVDLVVTDISMPQMDGLQMIEHLRKDDATKNLPVIIMSVDATTATLNQALQAGVTVYLSKSEQDPETIATQIVAAVG